MAGPHVVGVVALLWQAKPALVRDIAATKALLNSTANPNVTVSNGTQCGGIDHVPNNHFGYGLVDALAAYNSGGAAAPATAASATATTTGAVGERRAAPQDLFGGARRDDGTYVYSFGGYSFSTAQTLDVVYRYDPATNAGRRWHRCRGKELVASAVYYPPTNKIYVFGGAQRDAAIVLDTTQIYDIASNTWSMGATMPAPRSQHGRGLQPGQRQDLPQRRLRDVDHRLDPGHDLGVRPGREHLHDKAPSPTHAGRNRLRESSTAT